MSATDVMSRPLEHSFEKEDTFRLGLKELLFLAFILFIGFCGFTVCVDKIYSVSSDRGIKSITVHDNRVSTELLTPRPQNGLYFH